MKHGKTWAAIGGIVAVTLAVVCSDSGTSHSPSGASSPNAPISSSASSSRRAPRDAAECGYLLAVIDAKGPVSRSSVEVALETQLVENISRLTNEEPQTIGDCTVYTKQVLERDHGVKVSNCRLLTETYNGLRVAPAGTLTFKDALALVGTTLSSE